MQAAVSSQPPPSEARCLTHPDTAALGTCARCGSFFCAQDAEKVDGQDYCATCAARPEVNYLEAFRLKCWGTRDAWSWFIGLGALVNFALGVSLLTGHRAVTVLGGMSLAMGAVGACFWWGLPWARLALCLMPFLSTAVTVAIIGPQAIAQGLLPMLLMAGVYRDTRNRLFFKQEVSREALQKAWHLYANNTLARGGFLLSLFGLLIPVFAPFGVVCSLIGLRRVDPTARPPIGRKGQAIAGIILGVVAVLGWGTLLGTMFFSRWH